MPPIPVAADVGVGVATAVPCPPAAWVPNTATRNEALRVEIEKKQASTLNHASQRLSM